MIIHLLYKVTDQFRRMQLIMLVHEKITGIEASLHPLFYALHPHIYPGKIGRMQAITYEPYEAFRGGQMHVHTIASACRISDYRTSFMATQKTIQCRIIALLAGVPFFMPQFQEHFHILWHIINKLFNDLQVLYTHLRMRHQENRSQVLTECGNYVEKLVYFLPGVLKPAQMRDGLSELRAEQESVWHRVYPLLHLLAGMRAVKKTIEFNTVELGGIVVQKVLFPGAFRIKLTYPVLPAPFGTAYVLLVFHKKISTSTHFQIYLFSNAQIIPIPTQPGHDNKIQAFHRLMLLPANHQYAHGVWLRPIVLCHQ